MPTSRTTRAALVSAAMATALGALATTAPSAGAARLGYGGPGQKPEIVAGVAISTTVNGRVLVETKLPRKDDGKRFVIIVDGKIVARGRVSAHGLILTEFGDRHNAAGKRGAKFEIVISGKIAKTFTR